MGQFGCSGILPRSKVRNARAKSLNSSVVCQPEAAPGEPRKRGLAYPGTLFDFTYRNKGEIQAHGLRLRSELLTSLIVEFRIQDGGP